MDRYIWFRGKQIPVDEDTLQKYRRFVWSERKKSDRAKRCIDERGIRCTGDCKVCTEKHDDSVYSLDKLMENGFDAADPSDVAEIVADKQLLDSLLSALGRLDDDERGLIDALFYKNKTERELSEETGIPQKTINNRKRAIIKKLRNLFK